jgi:hypothetical protein
MKHHAGGSHNNHSFPVLKSLPVGEAHFKNRRYLRGSTLADHILRLDRAQRQTLLGDIGSGTRKEFKRQHTHKRRTYFKAEIRRALEVSE